MITSYGDEAEERLEAPHHPRDADLGTREVPFSGTVLIEREDFMEDPPRKFHRLAPGREVRLRYAYLVTCTGFDRDPDSGEVTTVYCTHDPASRGGNAPDGRKVRGTVHWVCAAHAVPAEVRLYDLLFNDPEPAAATGDRPLRELVNPHSRRVAEGWIEPELAASPPGTRVQLERLGYFCVDDGSTGARPVLNRTVTLRDSWAKLRKG